MALEGVGFESGPDAAGGFVQTLIATHQADLSPMAHGLIERKERPDE